MRDVKCSMKFAPTAHRKEEAERLNHNDAPIATRLMRSKDKDACANNHTDKQSQPSKHQHQKSKYSEVKKSEVQPSKDEVAKKINDYTISPSSSKAPDNTKELKSPSSRNDHEKKQLAQKRAAQAKSTETGNVSSSSHWKEKEKSTRPSQKPPKQPIIEESTRREGSGNANQCMSYMCQLCEQDLAVSPFEEEAEPPHLPPQDEVSYSLDYFLQQEEGHDNSLLPEVSVFSCGHVFHSLCFQLAQVDEQISHVCDPTCPICLSFS